MFRDKKCSLKSNEITKESLDAHFRAVFETGEADEVEIITQVETFSVNNTQTLDGDIAMIELLKATQRLANNKPLGADGIPNEVWKALDNNT